MKTQDNESTFKIIEIVKTNDHQPVCDFSVNFEINGKLFERVNFQCSDAHWMDSGHESWCEFEYDLYLVNMSTDDFYTNKNGEDDFLLFSDILECAGITNNDTRYRDFYDARLYDDGEFIIRKNADLIELREFMSELRDELSKVGRQHYNDFRSNEEVEEEEDDDSLLNELL